MPTRSHCPFAPVLISNFPANHQWDPSRPAQGGCRNHCKTQQQSRAGSHWTGSQKMQRSLKIKRDGNGKRNAESCVTAKLTFRSSFPPKPDAVREPTPCREALLGECFTGLAASGDTRDELLSTRGSPRARCRCRAVPPHPQEPRWQRGHH